MLKGAVPATKPVEPSPAVKVRRVRRAALVGDWRFIEILPGRAFPALAPDDAGLGRLLTRPKTAAQMLSRPSTSAAVANVGTWALCGQTSRALPQTGPGVAAIQSQGGSPPARAASTAIHPGLNTASTRRNRK